VNALNLRIPIVDRDMFMRFRGGGVGHKSMPTEMRCLLDDRGFEKEKERSQSRSELEATEEDEDMIDEDEDDEDEEEDEDGDAEDEGEDEDDLEGGEEGDEGVLAATPLEAYVDDEVADEMDEYGYSGLDRVINEDDENEEIEDDENAFGPEDGEDVTNEFEG